MNKTIVLLTLFTPSISAWAESVQIPIHISSEFLKHQIANQIFTEPQQSIEVWRDSGDCNSLRLYKPNIAASDEGITVTMNGRSQIGQLIGEQCTSLTPWSGTVSLLLTPSFTPDRNSVVLHIEDSEVLDSDGKPSVTGRIWSWTKKYVHPHLQQIQIDLHKPIQDLRNVLQQLVPVEDTTQATDPLQSVRFLELKPTSDGISLMLEIEASVGSQLVTPQPEPILTEDELERFDHTLNQWDAFITLVIRSVAIVARDPTIRDQLLEILLESRHEIINVLSTDIMQRDSDPVRKLFTDTWIRLAPIAQRISLSLPGNSSIHFVSFIAAADALTAIDRLGPSFNVEISTFALRRMARLIAPGSDDPLKYNQDVDPELRDLFDFGAPLPTLKPNTSSSIDWFINSAWAQVWDRDSIERLNLWVPTRRNIRSYLTRIRWLLEDTSDTILRDQPVDTVYEDLFRPLVLAVAWQETCWRQYTNSDGKRWPIKSSAGAVGMMQVLPRVWRGFYDPHDLAWDIGYNTSAGTEILRHYLVRYAIRHKEHEKTENILNLARATYAAYNGGPRHLTRYRLSTTPKKLQAIDHAFWEKYETVRNGNALGVLACYN